MKYHLNSPTSFMITILFVLSALTSTKSRVYRRKEEEHSSKLSPSINVRLDKKYADGDQLQMKLDTRFIDKGHNPNDPNICNTTDCYETAKMMLKKMMPKADPCQDFNEYACGGFIDDPLQLPASTVEIQIQHEKVFQDILTDEITAADPDYLRSMKIFYKSCMDIDQIEANGIQDFMKETQFVQDWPTLNPKWDSTNYSLKRNLERYTEANVWVLFKILLDFDFKNNSIRNVFVGDGGLELPQKLYSKPEGLLVKSTYLKLLVQFAEALGAGHETAVTDATDVIKLETALSQIMPSAVDKFDKIKAYHPTTVGNFSAKYPNIYIMDGLKSVMRTANVELKDQDTIINLYPKYFQNLGSVLKQFSNRTVQNFFGFRNALTKLRDLTEQMRQIQLEFNKVFKSTITEANRNDYCLQLTMKSFPWGISKQFVSRKFSSEAKQYMGTLTDNIVAAFKKILEENTWMEKETKESALIKLASMKRKIGYPEGDFGDADINKRYSKLNLSQSNFYSNYEQVKKNEVIEHMSLLNKPKNRNDWHKTPYEVSAFYSLSNNDITFLAGMLWPPYFSTTFPNYLNYGAIGVVVGHEITHGFDTSGSNYNVDGNFGQWWHEHDYDVFQDKTKCIIDQYSGFHINSIHQSIDGRRTQTENTADIGGLKFSFRAYKEVVTKEGQQPMLPLLGLTQDQLFFLSFAQSFCEKLTYKELKMVVRREKHTPGKYRIIGTLQNSEDFAKVYNCPKGSYMNPERKCGVWVQA